MVARGFGEACHEAVELVGRRLRAPDPDLCGGREILRAAGLDC
jgi:hypothetical protein